MYRLFNRISKGLDPIADCFKEHVESEGMKLVKQVRLFMFMSMFMFKCSYACSCACIVGAGGRRRCASVVRVKGRARRQCTPETLAHSSCV
jgi:hypothetical protein